jgi:hypothetical protein
MTGGRFSFLNSAAIAGGMSTVPKELREYFDMADVDENNQRGTIGNNQHQGFFR